MGGGIGGIDGMARLNSLSPQEVEAALLSCCGSSAWVQKMAGKRPFGSLPELQEASDEIWRGLGQEDWLEAFRRHPKIGGEQAEQATTAEAERWSAEEQGSRDGTPPETIAALAEGNRAYQERFGYLYIVCATGKTQKEMLALLRQRLQNDPDTEIHIAAEEQRRITNLRLEKLLQPLKS